MGGNRILQGVTGGKRILLHCRGPYNHVQKVTREKGTPPPTPTKEKRRDGASTNG